MQICFVSREYPPDTAFGGIATFTRAIAWGMAERGHSVQVISWAQRGGSRTERDGPVVVHRIEDTRTPVRMLSVAYGARATPLISTIERSVAVARKLRQIIVTTGLDLVEFPDWGAEGLVSLLRLRRRVPMVVRLHTSLQIVARLNGVVPRRSPSFWLSTRLENLCVRRASARFSPSRALAVLSARDMGFPSERVHIVPNPIDAETFTPDPNHAARATPPVILYVGRVERRKGVLVFPHVVEGVVERFPSATFEFVGADTPTAPTGGSMTEYLRNAVPPTLRPHLVFRGAVARADLVERYRGSAVCVFPSVFENFPNTCLEAMACGRPVIGSRAGGMAEMIEEGRSGLLVEPDDPGQLKAAIVKVLEQREWGERLGAEARRRIERSYTLAAVSRVMSQCYESIAGRVPCLAHGL